MAKVKSLKVAACAIILFVVTGTACAWQDPEKAPRVQFAPIPSYPEAARRLGLSGDAVLSVVTEGDRVDAVTVLESTFSSAIVENTLSSPLGAILARAAEESVRAWRFERGDEGRFDVRFRYRLADESGNDLTEKVTMRLPGYVEVSASALGLENVLGTSCSPHDIRTETVSFDGRYVAAIAERNCEGVFTEVLLREATGMFDSPPVLFIPGEVDVQLGWSQEGILSIALQDDSLGLASNPWGKTWRDVPIVYHVLPYRDRPPAIPGVSYADVPYYPLDALRLGIEGDVILSVSTDGTAIFDVQFVDFSPSVDLLSGGVFLVAAADVNLRSWRLEPHAAQTFQVVFRYRIDEDLDADANGEVVLLKLPAEVDVTSLPFIARSEP